MTTTSVSDDNILVDPTEDMDDDDVEEELSDQPGDGLADMMSKILNQQVNSSAPVLAKRKTSLMKELEQDKRETKKSKLSLEEKLKQGSKQMVDPCQGQNVDFERQLKRLATRGVVALFNAIAQAKKDVVSEESCLLANADQKDNKKKKDKKDKEVVKPTKKEENKDNIGWSALKEDLFTKSSLALKNWDQDSSEEEQGDDDIE